MGSPISVVLAELTMQHIERKIFSQTPIELPLWKRYLDDIIAIIPNDKINEFHDFLNSLHNNI